MTDAELVLAVWDRIKVEFLTVLNGEKTKVSVKVGCPSDGDKVLTGLGAESLDDTTTNGWQHDSWTTYEYQGREFTLEGSGYYGGLRLYPKEED